MYHRIVDNDVDPWDIVVSPENFDEQLKVLKDYNVISLDEIDSVLDKNGSFPANTVAITFDDGYIDNYRIAKPILETHEKPATFFIAKDAIEKQQEYWWDTLEHICFRNGPLPEELVLDYSKAYWQKTNGRQLAAIDTSNSLSLYKSLCDLTRRMPSDVQNLFIDDLKAWSSTPFEQRPEYLAMQKHELLDLISNPFFTIGGHSVTHPFLPNFSHEYQHREIMESVEFLEKLTRNKIKYFAYPHGGKNATTLEIMSKSNIKLGFTTHQDCFYKHTNRHELPRMHVKNWDGKTFASELKSYFN